MSWCGIVDAFSKALGQSLPIQFVNMGEPLPGLPDVVPPVLAGMETYDSPVAMDELANLFGVKQTSLEMFVHHMLNIPGG